MQLVAISHAAPNHFIKARKAQRIYREQRSEEDGRCHPDTIFALNKMAEYQNNFGKHLRGPSIKGPICRKEVVERAKSIFRETDPRTLQSMGLLAEGYYNMRSFTKADQIQERIVKEMVRTYGIEHKKAEKSREFLAKIRKAGKLSRLVYWWLPIAVREIEFPLNGSIAKNFQQSNIIAGG
jgi:hypothetical protein